jgi:hypothetical protein
MILANALYSLLRIGDFENRTKSGWKIEAEMNYFDNSS